MVKGVLKKILPTIVLLWYGAVVRSKWVAECDKNFAGKDPGFIFSFIYKNNLWGGAGFFSGPGSHEARHVAPYVEGVKSVLGQFPEKLSVVDLGCGDFNVGRQLVSSAHAYTGCDVVADLIESHRQKYKALSLRFIKSDIVSEPLPEGDIVILRQVLQHLSNAQIQKVVEKVKAFRYLIVSEHLPRGEFQPNVDQPCGAQSRLARGIPSGIVLTAPPFNLEALSERVLARTEDEEGIIQTTLYEFRP